MAQVVKNLPNCSHRYALMASYIGTKYRGSQRLTLRDSVECLEDTVQEALECSLQSFLPKDKCPLTSASRTDKGVHAFMNCFSLKLLDHNIPTERVKLLCNKHLMTKNHDISVREVILVPADFHPRKAIESREYIYRIGVMKKSVVQGTNHTKHHPEALFAYLPINELYRILPLPCFNYTKALEAIDLFRGEHDFAAFSKGADERTTRRHMEIELSQKTLNTLESRSHSNSDWTVYQFHFKSEGFLHNQIRRIVGSIISYATYGVCELIDIKYLLERGDPTRWDKKIIIADPWGLYLSKLNFKKGGNLWKLMLNLLTPHNATCLVFEGSLKTFEGNLKENVETYPSFEESDDGDYE